MKRGFDWDAAVPTLREVANAAETTIVASTRGRETSILNHAMPLLRATYLPEHVPLIVSVLAP